MVRAIERKGGAENPYAVATARLGRESFVHHSKPRILAEKIRGAFHVVMRILTDHEKRLRALERR
jgi:hypothetical protein